MSMKWTVVVAILVGVLGIGMLGVQAQAPTPTPWTPHHQLKYDPYAPMENPPVAPAEPGQRQLKYDPYAWMDRTAQTPAEPPQRIDPEQLPKAVKRTLEREAPGQAIRGVQLDRVDGRMIYQVQTRPMPQGSERQFKISYDGQLLERSLAALNEAPEAVQEASRQYLGTAAPIEQIRMESINGLPTYALTSMSGERQRNLRVTEQGGLVSLEQRIAADRLPVSITSRIRDFHPQATIEEVTERQVTLYEINLREGDRVHTLHLTSTADWCQQQPWTAQTKTMTPMGALKEVLEHTQPVTTEPAKGATPMQGQDMEEAD